MNPKNPHISDELLVKYLMDEGSPEEKEMVEAWIAADEANQQYYKQFQKIWESSRMLAVHYTADEQAAWQRFRQRIHQPKKVLPVHRFQWLRIAALFIIIAGAGFILFSLFNRNVTQQLELVSGNGIKTDTLADGSVITLNKNSALSYPNRFSGKVRAVALSGEAFFRVSPDRKKPFIVQVNDVTIKVLGTSFNVRSRNGTIEVIVESGIVQVNRNNKVVELRAGEKALVGGNNVAPLKEKENEHLYNYYRTREFVCDNTPLWKLVEVLNEAYGSNIVIESPQLRNLQLTASFSNESLDRILQIISETFDIRVDHEKDKIIIR